MGGKSDELKLSAIKIHIQNNVDKLRKQQEEAYKNLGKLMIIIDIEKISSLTIKAIKDAKANIISIQHDVAILESILELFK